MPLPASFDGKKAVPAPDPLPSPVVDAHTHLDACGADTPELVGAAMHRAAAVGVAAVVTVGDDLASARWAARAATWHPDLYAAVALHPTRADELDDDARIALTALARQERVVAVGETGLDHYWYGKGVGAAPAVQRDAFAWHLQLAKDVGKPVMIHDRDAHDAVFDVLDAEGAPETVIFHCFSGDAAMARRCADAGYLMSFAGPVSFRSNVALHEAAAVAPSELLLVETDAPYLTPHPHRGRINEPAAAAWTVRALADLRGDDLEELCHTLLTNSRRAYRLPSRRTRSAGPPEPPGVIPLAP